MSKKNKRSILSAMLILLISLTSLSTTANTWGKYTHTTTKTDSAAVAEFDIEIIAPVEFDAVSEETPYQHSFSEKGQTKSFDFRITNNKSVTVICTPTIDSNLQYNIITSGAVCESFVVEIGETVDFQVVLLSTGLKAVAITANLTLDIQQI